MTYTERNTHMSVEIKIGFDHIPQAPLLGLVANTTAARASSFNVVYGPYDLRSFSINAVTLSSATRETVKPPQPAPIATRASLHFRIL